MWLSIDGLRKQKYRHFDKMFTPYKYTNLSLWYKNLAKSNIRFWLKRTIFNKNYHLSRKIHWENAFGKKPAWNKDVNSTTKHDTILRKWIYKSIRIQIRDPTVWSGYGPARLWHTERCSLNESSFSPKHPFTASSTMLFVRVNLYLLAVNITI